MRVAKFSLPMLVVGLSALYFLASGVHGALYQSCDFVPVYSGARCLFHGCNPYNLSQMRAEYLSAGGQDQTLQEVGGWEDETELYPPSTFAALAPLGLLPFPAARLLWWIMNGCLFLAAVALVLSLCPQTHRWLAAIFSSFYLFASIGICRQGQASAFAVSTLVVSSVLILRRRYLPLAAVLLMLSLAVKPQIGGLVAIYFLADRAVRRYALLALDGALAFLLIGGFSLQMHPSRSNWVSDMRSNIEASMAPGQINDPAFPSIGEINIEAVTSVFLPNQSISLAVASCIFLLLLATWATAWLRHNPDSPQPFIALGALLVLSLLPVYHRQGDAVILLLSVPSIVVVLEKRRVLGMFIAGLTPLGSAPITALLNGYLAVHAPGLRQHLLQSKYLIYLVLSRADDLPSRFAHLLDNKLLFLLVLRQQNLALLLLACLYIAAAFIIRLPRNQLESNGTRPLSKAAIAGKSA